MQKCFDEKDIAMLQTVISKLDPTVGYKTKSIPVSFVILSSTCSGQAYDNIHCTTNVKAH